MNSHESSPERRAEATNPGASADVLSARSAERRRALLKGVGKGSALLAAAAPLTTLAGQTLLTSDQLHQCSVSGMQSGVHSASPNIAICTGYTPSIWGQSTNGTSPTKVWPTLPNGYSYLTLCRTVFTRSTLTGTPSLFKVLNSATYASSDERHWICAWLNGLWDDQKGYNQFPYSGAEVLAFYNSTTNYQNALSFFKTYMETRTS